MAKLKLPLASFEARGSLGKNLVYFPWKGINCVREYVIPADPETTPKRDQRNRMAAAMAEFHGATYSAADLVAFSRLAGAEGKTMTGPNRMIQAHLLESIRGGTWERITHVVIEALSSVSIGVTIYQASGAPHPDLHWGTRKTYFPEEVPLMDMGGDVYSKTLIGLTPDTPYYFYIDIGAKGVNYGRTGIYVQRTDKA